MAESTVSIDQVEALLEALKNNQVDQVQTLIDEITQIRQSELYIQLEQLTSNLHQTLEHIDDNTLMLQTKNDIPDATERLQYVIQTTEEASAKTIDIAEQALQALEKIEVKLNELTEQQQVQLAEPLQVLHSSLTEIMLTQSFQDLTGQVLNRVILVISSLETSLVDLIKRAGHDFDAIPERQQSDESKRADEMHGVGPNVTQKSKKDIVNQDDIDDLLSDLGI